MSQVLAFMLFAAAGLAAQEPAWDDLFEAGRRAYQQARYAEAEKQFQAALEAAEKAEPAGDRIGASLGALITVYRTLGKLEQAEPLYKRLLALHEQKLGFDNPELIPALNGYGSICFVLKKYDDAELALQRVLALREKKFGREHLEIANSLDSLARLYAKTEFALAEIMFKRALALREKLLGSDHLDVAVTNTELGALYRDKEKFDRAEPYFRAALSIRENALGSDNPELAPSLDNLGWICYSLRKFDEAEALYRRSLAAWERAMGPEHPSVAITLDNIGAVFAAQDRWEDAQPFYERALVIRERATLGSLANLGNLHEKKNDLAKAELFHRQALTIGEQVWGPVSNPVGVLLDKHVNILKKLGRRAEAAKQEARLKAIIAKSLESDPVTGPVPPPPPGVKRIPMTTPPPRVAKPKPGVK